MKSLQRKLTGKIRRKTEPRVRNHIRKELGQGSERQERKLTSQIRRRYRSLGGTKSELRSEGGGKPEGNS
jgi:hypothetical protein